MYIFSFIIYSIFHLSLIVPPQVISVGWSVVTTAAAFVVFIFRKKKFLPRKVLPKKSSISHPPCSNLLKLIQSESN